VNQILWQIELVMDHQNQLVKGVVMDYLNQAVRAGVMEDLNQEVTGVEILIRV
jgi:hypothetical protein